jgi:hypothetical protein
MKRAMPPTREIEELIENGYMSPITRQDSTDPKKLLVVGYEVTTKGEKAVEKYC